MLVEVCGGWALSELVRGLPGPQWALKEDFCWSQATFPSGHHHVLPRELLA